MSRVVDAEDRRHGSIIGAPAELGNHDDIVLSVRAGIVAVEHVCARDRATNNRRVVARRRILRQSWQHSDEPRDVPPTRWIHHRP